MTEEIENKKTFFKDEDGGWYDWCVCCGIVLLVMSFAIIIAIPIIGISAIGDYYEVKAFNNIHGTEYTFGEWFWAEGTIKEYHLGPVENKNYEVDLNINRVEKEVEENET